MERHRSRTNSREESARFTRGEDDKSTRGGLLEKLQECIGRLLTGLLGNECLGVPDYKDLPESHGWAAVGVGAQSLGDGQVDPSRFRRRRRRPKRTCLALCDRIVPSFFQGLRKLGGPNPFRFR